MKKGKKVKEARTQGRKEDETEMLVMVLGVAVAVA
jgi:hypothetical protein